MNTPRELEEVVEFLREKSTSGISVAELINCLRVQKNVDERDLVRTIYFFCQAFNLQVGDVKLLGSWQGFRGGVLTDEELEKELRPKISLF